MQITLNSVKQIVRTQGDIVMAVVAVSRQQSLLLPLLFLHHVALPHPSVVTLEQITIFLRLSFPRPPYDMTLPWMVWLIWFELHPVH